MRRTELRVEPSKAAMAAPASENANEHRANQRRRERSRSRDSPRNLPFPNRDFSPDDNKSDDVSYKADDDDNYSERRREPDVGASSGSSSSTCNCASCGPWPEEKYRDLSIRYPGMSKKSFDQMLLALDEVVVDDLVSGSVSESFSSTYSGVTFSPVEPPLVVPASPSELQATERADGAEGANDFSVQRGVEASGRRTNEGDYVGAGATLGQVEVRSGEELPHRIPGSP